MKHTYTVTIEPFEGMGLDTEEAVRDLLEEAFRDSGLDNSAVISIELVASEKEP